ncbi:cytoplasmic tRNA 2-thiolation protein 2-like isoform X2 [Babylonia areolata]|uniref:cytoplasmic tRNA 2-thiolation protein 2-like isoform X2 n=1 Tax=Babylonia areolata TaxID=304850 RepID=UPI003FD5F902
MCSVNEEAVPALPNKLQLDGELKCVKCRREDVPVVVTRVNDAFCQECFLVYAVHKFRSAIGKSRVIIPTDHVLVAYSGGPASSALLHFMQQGMIEGKLRFKVSVVHIDELGLVSISAEERKAKVDKVAHTVQQRGFPLFLTCLEEGMKIGCSGQAGGDSVVRCQEVTSQSDVGDVLGKSDTAALQSMLDALPSISAKEEFIRVLRNQLLVAVARQLGWRKVVVGDTATLLSVRIMTDMAKGKGSQVSLDTSIGDGRYGDVMMVRPLRDLNLKEVEAYNKLQNVDSVSIPHVHDKWHRGNSIEQLTTVFVTGLQENFPSTVPNIVRTSGKLGQEDGSRERGQCALCQSSLDTSVGEASALRAVEISERLSEGATVSDAETVCLESDRSVPGDVRGSLCYGCRLMIKGLKDISFLPPRVKSAALSRDEMRSQIAEYLLEEGSET